MQTLIAAGKATGRLWAGGPLSEDHGAGRCLACQTVHMARTYWIDLFTLGTWKEFLDHGASARHRSEWMNRAW